MDFPGSNFFVGSRPNASSERSTLDEIISGPSRRKRDAHLSASFGLICVAVFCLIGLPQSPARVALRKGAEKSSYEFRDSSNEEIVDIDTSTRSNIAANPLAEITEAERLSQADSSPRPLSKRSTSPGAWQAISEWWHSLFGKRSSRRSGNNGESNSTAATGSHLQERLASEINVKNYVEDKIEGMNIAYSRIEPQKSISGVAYLFHGCGQTARDWYELPEHREIVRQLRKARLATLALSARNDASRCWSTRYPPGQNQDIQKVSQVVQQWLQQHYLPYNVTGYGVGISSGGTFLSILSTERKFPVVRSQALYLSPGSMRAFRRADGEYPNTLFIHLRNDEHFASRKAVETARQELLRRGVPLVGDLVLGPVRLHESTFRARDPRFTTSQSKELFRSFKSCKARLFEDSKERECGYAELIQDIRRSGRFSPILENPQSQRALQQLVRVIAGQHEVQGQTSEKVTHWLRSHRRVKT